MIQGSIIPAFSWDSNEAFLKNGFGYIAMDEEKFAFGGAEAQKKLLEAEGVVVEAGRVNLKLFQWEEDQCEQ